MGINDDAAECCGVLREHNDNPVPKIPQNALTKISLTPTRWVGVNYYWGKFLRAIAPQTFLIGVILCRVAYFN
jgi:hypothetical protein